MKKELAELQPKLHEMSKQTENMMAVVSKEKQEASKIAEQVSKEEADANKKAKMTMQMKEECEKDLAEAIPILEDAIKSLDTLKPSDISEMKNFTNPPSLVVFTMEAVCVLLGISPGKVKHPDDPTISLDDWWGPSKKLLGERGFISKLKEYNRDNIKSNA